MCMGFPGKNTGVSCHFLHQSIHAAAAAKCLQSCPILCDPVAHQSPLSTGFSRQEYWSGLPFPSPNQSMNDTMYKIQNQDSKLPFNYILPMLSMRFFFSICSGSAPHLVQRRQWPPTPVLLPGKSHGLRSQVAAVPGVAKSWTRLSDFTFTFHFHALQKEMETHSSVLAWRIPGMVEPGGLQSMGSHRVRHD